MRKILTNKTNGATTYLEESDVEGFFMAGAHPNDYDISDEDEVAAEPVAPVEDVVDAAPAEVPAEPLPVIDPEAAHG